MNVNVNIAGNLLMNVNVNIAGNLLMNVNVNIAGNLLMNVNVNIAGNRLGYHLNPCLHTRQNGMTNIPNKKHRKHKYPT